MKVIASQRRRPSHLPNDSSRNAIPGEIPDSELIRAYDPHDSGPCFLIPGCRGGVAIGKHSIRARRVRCPHESQVARGSAIAVDNPRLLAEGRMLITCGVAVASRSEGTQCWGLLY